ncbi:MAG TPA: isoprenylcysteine carboxylmethyltransferase family protein [Gemmatimonadales bacterium]|nr:isoprenylcysteine carboxylmethyltransferase family protein [Gemmatimonadales bacterium]
MDLAKAARDPWVWGQTVLFVIVGLAAPLMPRHLNLGSADFMLNRVDPPRIRWLGLGLLVIAAVVIGWGVRSLGRNLTPGTEPLPGASLVTSGAYAHARHPIYTGVVLALAGYTLAWSNWTLALIVGFIALKLFDGKARREEKWLTGRFPDYEAYMRHVRRRVL